MALHPFKVSSTGGVVGGLSTQPCPTRLHGWFLSNAGAATYQLDIHVPTSTTSGAPPAVPSASDPILLSIQVPAASSKEYFEGKAIELPNGAYAVCSNASLTGILVIS